MENQRMWAVHHGDGRFEQIYCEDRPEIGGAEITEIERFGDLSVEQHVPGTGWTPLSPENRAKAAEQRYDIDSPSRRLIDYAIKQVEARIILGTLETDGLLAREAALRGMALADLAAAVLVRASETETELGRVAEKLSILNQGQN